MDGMPTGAQIQLYTDSLAGILKAAYAFLGLNNPGETGTLASLAAAKKTAILGDGATSYGLGAPAWQSAVAGSLGSLAARCRYDLFLASQMQPLMGQLDTLVKANLPASWQYATSGAQAHVIDLWLTRLNAINPATPITPTLNGTLTGVTQPAGTLPNYTLSNAPSVYYTYVGAYDYIESLPSPPCPVTPIVGGQNAYSMAMPWSVPDGVYKARIYRTYPGQNTPYFDQDVMCVPGSVFPTALILQNDAHLRADINPPSWMSALLAPEAAALFALAFASSGAGAAASGFGRTVSSVPASLAYNAANMISPLNVLAGPANGFVGVGNQPASSQFGQSTLAGANAQVYAPGQIQAVNVAQSNVQGYAGAMGIRARITSALDLAATVAISYTYLAATTGQTVATDTSSGMFSAGGVGTLLNLAVPAGRLILSATVTSVSGGTSAGAFVLEPTLRAY